MDRRDILKAAVLAAGGTAIASPAGAAQAATGALFFSAAGDAASMARFAGALKLIAGYADAHRRDYGLPGLTLACIGPGGYVGFVRSGYSKTETRTPLAADNLFQVGSISKSFVAMCVHQLADEGRLSLADDIRKILPEVALPPEPPIALENLLNHSSGLPDDAPIFPRTPDGRLWSAFPPGTAWSYSNTGYNLLGMVVERLDGAPLAQVLERRIFARLGMVGARGQIVASERGRYAGSYTPLDAAADSHVGGRLGPAAWVNVTTGAGCVAATSADMVHWLRYLCAAGAGKGAPLLSDNGARAYTKPTIAAPGWASPHGDARYGSGLAHVSIEGRTLLHHTGGMVSFSSSMHIDPASGVACFASTNSGQQEYRPRDVTAYACALLRSRVESEAGLSPKPASIKRAPTTKATKSASAAPSSAPVGLAALAGRYESDDPWIGATVIEARSDGLYIGGDVRLEAHPEGFWTPKTPVSTERLWFESVMNGRPQILNFSGTDLVRRDV